MTKKLVKSPPKLETEEDILERAREFFVNMQKSWWEFAKLIHAIKEGETFRVKGFETFRDYCESDYPETNYKTIMKFCTIVDTWGKAIDSKIAKDANYTLPAYESCYTVISVKDGILPKEDLDKLKRDVLEKKVSYHKLREKMKDLLDLKKSEIKAAVKSVDELEKHERELEAQIKDEELEDSEFSEEEGADLYDSFEEDDLEDLAPEDLETDMSALVSKCHKMTKELHETLKLVEERIHELGYNEKVRKFAYDLDVLASVVNEILEHVEE